MEITPDVESKHYAAQGRMGQMDNYYRWILANFGGTIGRRVWDAGAGVGHVTQLLADREDVELVLATEFTDQNLETLRQRFGATPGVEIGFCDLTSPESLALREHQVDTIITLDVLEHLEDDRAAIERYRDVLQPGGHLLVKVPAHPFLYGTMDEASLHYRRYRRSELREKLAGAGFEVSKVRPMNMVATLPYFLKGRILKKQRNFSNAIDGGKLGFYNQLMPWFERFERVVPPLFGLSLIAIARKPA